MATIHNLHYSSWLKAQAVRLALSVFNANVSVLRFGGPGRYVVSWRTYPATA